MMREMQVWEMCENRQLKLSGLTCLYRLPFSIMLYCVIMLLTLINHLLTYLVVAFVWISVRSSAVIRRATDRRVGHRG